MIRDLRHEIDEMGKTLTYLNSHEALLSKVRRRLGDKFNQKYPRGSAQRKRLAYQKEAILHPVRSHRLYATEEGRNLKKGDFEIGDIYRQHGKLRFEKQEHPKVSIVIPVYNQIHYTYACLESILEFTKDVTYEVIIADDVSTDATKDLGLYSENLVISRNSENQGFLRNCNQAAAKAKGIRFGRPPLPLPESFHENYQRWKSGEITCTAAARACGLPLSTFRDKAAVYEKAILP